MKKRLIITVSLVGILGLLSACGMNKTVLFPNTFCSAEAQSDFSSGLSAYEKKNYEQSFKLFSKASENNCANADFYLAVQYNNGQFVPKDLKIAKEKFKQSCDNGLKTACDYKIN